MASALIGALRVSLGLDSAAFEKGADRSIKKMDAFERAGHRTGKALRGLAGIAVTAGVALASVFTARAVRDALDYAASIGEVATQLGVTTKELQVYRYAATQVNLTQEEVEKGLAKLTLTIGKAGAGAKNEAQYFNKLGISIKDTEGRIRPTGDILLDLADRLAAIPDPAQRAAAVFAIFGRQGQKLIPLLEGGSKGLRQFAKDAEEAGLVISEGDIAKADETADKIEGLTTQLKVNFSRVVAQNSGAILGLANALATLLVKLAQVGAWFTNNAQVAAILFGVGVGARVGGIWGAVAGGIAGGIGGGALEKSLARGNTDLAFREKELRAATKRMRDLLSMGGRGLGDPRSGPFRAAQASLDEQRRLMSAARTLNAQAQAMAKTSGEGLDDLFQTGGGGGGKSKARDEIGRLQSALRDLGSDIEAAFDTRSLPRSIEVAESLREKLADIAERAREAGVPMSAFSGQMASLQARIDALTLEGLAREAEDFAQEVERTARAVRQLDLGAMTPLEQRLDEVDERYGSLRERILQQIKDNRELASANEDAAKKMAELVAMLERLDGAHRRAADGARAQYQAEQLLRDLAAEQATQRLENNIADLRRARGDSGVFTSAQLEAQKIERQLQADRLAALDDIAVSQDRLRVAQEKKDADEVLRLTGLIALQEQYYDLVSDTTAQQIVASQRLQNAFEDFTNGLSDSLYDMVTRFDFSLRSLADVFLKLLNDIFLRPALDSIAGSISGALSGLFAGGFATGGVIPRGQWGIVGERGPEPIFAGDRPLSILPNDVLSGGQRMIFNISVNGPMSDRDARRTGNQIGAAASARMSAARRAGLAG